MPWCIVYHFYGVNTHVKYNSVTQPIIFGVLYICLLSDSRMEEMTKKERKKQRRMLKSNYEVAVQAKQLWMKLRKYVQ